MEITLISPQREEGYLEILTIRLETITRTRVGEECLVTTPLVDLVHRIHQVIEKSFYVDPLPFRLKNCVPVTKFEV